MFLQVGAEDLQQDAGDDAADHAPIMPAGISPRDSPRLAPATGSRPEVPAIAQTPTPASRESQAPIPVRPLP